MTPDLERVLSCLLHDLRSPLGVAGGYLRLLREGRLASGEETERAIAKAQDALRVMTGLCGDATAWLDLEPPTPPRRHPLAAFLALVAAHADTQMVAVTLPVPSETDTITLTSADDAVARAVAVLLNVVSSLGTRTCVSEIRDGTLRFAVMAADAPAGVTTFDPWRYRGLGAPLASRLVTQAGGRCTAGDADREALRIAFTLGPAPAA